MHALISYCHEIVRRKMMSLRRAMAQRLRSREKRAVLQALSDLSGGCGWLRFRPIVRHGLGLGELARILVTRRHRRGGSGQHFVVLDIEKPQPTLLAQREPDHTAEFNQFRLGEMAMEAIPEGVVGLQMPDDGFRIREGWH